MEPLQPTDPAHLGGYRLLGRLGAGGMGVVYLARSQAGELAAVKVIQPEFAEQAEFRARFRREAATGRQVDSPWVVPVLGADTEAVAPWLATAFVPGPSLAEAVAACGPLPERAVRILGKILARALSAVHAADLVHRDLKPGNVLLALDGPRLIDFGIARPTATEATALTSDGMVIGTPGFLSPEQARGQRIGPPSDVFSLAGLLTYAATGRPPFGSGASDALLYRTVHDAPDLDGMADDELRALLERCLAKDPAQRPSAADVDAALVEDTPAGDIDWLPDPVVRIVADRSAQLLALPGIEPTAASAPDPRSPGRRRVLALAGGGAALLAAGGGTALWAVLRDGASGSPAVGPRWTLGVHADLSGPQGKAGKAQERGARLAVEQFNARAEGNFTLELRVEDDRGEAERARQVARRLTGDRDVLAVLGPTGYAATQAALEIYDGAGQPLLTVSELSLSAAQTGLGTAEPRAYFHTTPMTAHTAYTTVAALRGQGTRRLGLLADRAGRLAGWESVNIAHSAAGSAQPGLHFRVVPAVATQLAPVVADMLDHGVDGFYYVGTPERAAQVARALADRGFTGPRFLDAPSATAAFTSAAGKAAAGWQVLTSYIGPQAQPVRSFAAAYRKRYASAPGPWAAEAYDIARLVAGRIDALAGKTGDRRPSREQLARAVAQVRFKGVAATYAFNDSRRVEPREVHHYRVAHGRFGYVGPMGIPGA
ncbi:bifunctional serine/threonine-protein kinase/ABC transporter substrate-binding protein [Streptomyces sp. NPDC004752]